MGRLRGAMTSRFKERDEDVKIHTPRNLETLNLSFRGERVAKVLLYCPMKCLVDRGTGHWYLSGQTSSDKRLPLRIISC